MNPTALVTGGAVRVGRAIALGLAEAGYDLVLTYRSSAGPAEETRTVIEAMGRRCTVVRADMADPTAIAQLGVQVRDAHGRLDVLVNSAASFQATTLLDIDAEEWTEVLDVNLRAPHLMVRAFADLLRESRGSVVNISDHMGLEPWVRYAHHSVSKAALIHLTRIQARALAPDVRVNAVAPGLVMAPDGMDESALADAIDATLLKRAGTAEDVSEAVLYLARASYVTGHVLVVDGGVAGKPDGVSA
jgi:pteridine reductase